MQQFDLSERIVDKISIGSINTLAHGNRNISFDESSCQCSFFNVMRLPCRHLFALFKRKKMDLYVPELCDQRWYKNKFENFKRNETIFCSTKKPNSNDSGHPKVVERNSIAEEELTESQKFREIREKATNLADISSKQPETIFRTILSKLEKLIAETTSLINDSHLTQSQSCQINEETNDLDSRCTKDCVCGFNDRDHRSGRRTCTRCQKFIHSVCFGILDGYSDAFNSRLDSSIRVTCHRCPPDKDSDKELLLMSSEEVSKKVIIRAALASLVMGSEVFPRECNQIQPIMSYLREKNWYKLLYSYFMQVDPDPDAPEFLSLRYDPPSESVNIEIDVPSDDENKEDVDLGNLMSIFQSSSSPVVVQQDEDETSSNFPSLADDHRYHTVIEHLELPPVLLNIRPTRAKSVSKKKSCLKTFAALRSIEKRKRKF